ncbi:MAG: DUF433 domain-containing protein [Anaerolineae bacterium]|nr:DUF433 domain-containing protein [Anaerolineae bacterium]MDQ7037346.1 DUF433 domain-containing protein [Anaerolineae bacterium]
MVLEIHAETAPLRTSPDGVVYIGQTRIPLETVVSAFNEGVSSEEIAMQYPALSLSHIYQTIGYYLAHREEIDAYISEAVIHSEQVYTENQARFNTSQLRERLLQRQSENKS